MPSAKALERSRPSGDEILAKLRTFDRDPFAVQLAQLLDCAPTAKAIRKFANKYPDRWAQAVSIFSGLNGYSAKTEVINNNLFMVVGKLSDAEIEQRLRVVLPKLAISQARIIDGTAEVAAPEPPKDASP